MLLNKLRAPRFGLLTASLLIVTFAGSASSVTLEGEAAFALNVDAERISLEANSASLEMILARLSEAIDIPIRALVGDSERITVTFRDLPLKEAMKRLSNRVVYIHDPQTGAINRIVVLPEGSQPPRRASNRTKAAGPEPFKFEFDPSQATEN